MRYSTVHLAKAALALVFASGLFCLIAAYNGYPLLYPDSSSYLFFAKFFKSAGERPILYGLLLALGQMILPTYWFGVLAQSFLSAILIRWTMTALAVRCLNFYFCVVCLALALLTGIGWQTGQLMADAFTAPMVLSFYLLIFHRGKLGAAKEAVAELILLFSLCVHLSHWPILVISAFTLWASYRLKGRRLFAKPPILLIVAVLAVLPLTSALNSTFGFSFGYSKNQYAFLVSRLVEDGSVARFLEQNCDKEKYLFCGDRAYVTNQSAASFLWGPRGPFSASAASAQDYRDLAWAVIRAEPIGQFGRAVAVFAWQLIRFESGEAIGPWSPGSWEYEGLKETSREEFARFERSRQQNGTLGPLASKMNIAYYFFFGLAVIILVASIGKLFRDWPQDASLALTVGVFFLSNAFVCGVFSGAYNRYQSRLAWLPVFVALLILVRWRERRASF